MSDGWIMDVCFIFFIIGLTGLEQRNRGADAQRRLWNQLSINNKSGSRLLEIVCIYLHYYGSDMPE